MAKQMIEFDKMTRDEKILSNQNLVWNVIHTKFNSVPIDKDDLFQTGMTALIRAVDSYDSSKGEFSTIAITAIKREIKRYVIQSKTIQIPEYLNLDVMKISSIVQEIEKNGEKATPKKVAEKCNITSEEAKKFLDIYRYSSDPMSLDAETEEGGSLMDTLSVNDVDGLHNSIYLQEILDAIEEIYGKKYADIIKAYHVQGLTLEEVGNKFGVTRERVRQIINKIDCTENKTEKDTTKFRLLKRKLGY